MKHLALICLAALLLVGAQAHAAAISEGFESGIPSDWVTINHSNPVGDNSTEYIAQWHAYDVGLDGMAPNTGSGYACARDASCVAGDIAEGNIDNWMLTPVVTFAAGDTLTFYTRAYANWNDGMEVRLSTAGSSVNCGTQAPALAGAPGNIPDLLANVGDFSTLLVVINPWAADGTAANVYPLEWTQFTVTMPAAGEGRIGFRYIVPDGGYVGINSGQIALDDVQFTPEPATMSLLVIGGVAALLRRRHA